MKLNSLASAPIQKGIRVLVRIDSDIDIVRGKIAPESAYRLDCVLPTLKFLLKKKAVVTVMGHRGRPAGKKVAALSLAPAQKYLEGKLKTKLNFLPNTRFDAREEKNDIGYARELAEDQDIFINDSFATAHRKHASTHAITRVLPSYAGLQFVKEVEELEAIRDASPQPLSLIIGGSKIETKIPLINQFTKYAQHIFIVGAAANAFFAARGMKIGSSVVSPASIRAAKKLLLQKNIIIPVDVIVQSGKKSRAVALPDESNQKRFEICSGREMILDIGPASLVCMSEMLASARGIIWNGPPGKFEQQPFHLGTVRVARMLAHAGRSGATVVAGGGETVTGILQSKMSNGYTHISTGGGAMLEFLSGARMPVIEALLAKTE
jgi:phosphoglycerate kinase